MEIIELIKQNKITVGIIAVLLVILFFKRKDLSLWWNSLKKPSNKLKDAQMAAAMAAAAASAEAKQSSSEAVNEVMDKSKSS